MKKFGEFSVASLLQKTEYTFNADLSTKLFDREICSVVCKRLTSTAASFVSFVSNSLSENRIHGAHFPKDQITFWFKKYLFYFLQLIKQEFLVKTCVYVT